MGEEGQYADAVHLITPERLPQKRVSQYSVVRKAMEFLGVVTRHKSLRNKLKDRGIEFGGRVLLIGSVGTDFEAFVHHLSQEIPIKIAELKIRETIQDRNNANQVLRTAFEFAKRNAPSILWVNRLEFVAPAKSPQSAVLAEEMSDTTWDEDEVLVVTATSNPKDVDPWLLSGFDRTYTLLGLTLDDRIRVFEEALKGREDIDPAIVAELTEGWSFADVRHLAASLLLEEESTEGQISREQIEELLVRSGVFPFGRAGLLESVDQRLQGGETAKFERVEETYPDDFLEQLYLMAVGDDFHRTQAIIETLNQGAPLSSNDLDFLSRYPFLMNGSPDERLTRLLRAKKSSDRLSRIMGR